MKNLQRVRTRRQLFRVTAVGAASIPFLALTRKSASAQHRTYTSTPAPTAAIPSTARLLFKGDKDFNSFGRSSGAGTANRR